MRHALVVDDDPFLVRTLADVLRLQQWEVTPAYSGTEAVNEAARVDFDVVLMDIRMPGMDGVAAFKAMRQMRPALRFVLMTAYASDALMDEARRVGAMRVLAKPVNVHALMALIESKN